MQAPHGFYKKLVANGFTDQQAEGLTEAHTEFFSEVLEKETKLIKVDFKSQLATKQDVQAVKDDLQNVKDELKNDVQAVKDDLQNVKDELKNDVQNVKDELKNDVQNVKDELKNDVQNVKDELKSDIHLVALSLAELNGNQKWFKWLLLSVFAVQVFPLFRSLFEKLF